MTAGEQKVAAELLSRLSFGEELGLLRLRILRMAKAPEEDDDRGFKRVRLMVGMLDVLVRLGNLQAKVERLGDGGAGEMNALIWDEARPADP
jgi:hypothetical protein